MRRIQETLSFPPCHWSATYQGCVPVAAKMVTSFVYLTRIRLILLRFIASQVKRDAGKEMQLFLAFGFTVRHKGEPLYEISRQFAYRNSNPIRLISSEGETSPPKDMTVSSKEETAKARGSWRTCWIVKRNRSIPKRSPFSFRRSIRPSV